MSASSSGTGHDAAAARPSTGHATTCAITATGYCTCVGADLPVAAPDPAETIGRLIDEAVALQAADPEPENTERRFTELRDDLVVAALYELPALLAERQQDKERIERLEKALTEIGGTLSRWSESLPAGTQHQLTHLGRLARAALAVEEDAKNG